MRSPEVLRSAIAVSLAVAIGAGALTGCAGESDAGRPASTMEVGPDNQVPSSGVDTIVTSMTMEPNVTLVEPGVAESLLGDLKDDALQATYAVSEYTIQSDQAYLVADARAKVDALGDIRVVPGANLHIDLRMAEAVSHGANLYTHQDSDYILETNKERLDAHEAAVDLIQDTDVKAKAELALDLVQADKAMDASLGAVPAPMVSEQMLSYIEDPAIKQMALDAIDQSVTKSEPAGKLATMLSEARQAIKDQAVVVWRALYNGSNSQARNINSEIEAFNGASQTK